MITPFCFLAPTWRNKLSGKEFLVFVMELCGARNIHIIEDYVPPRPVRREDLNHLRPTRVHRAYSADVETPGPSLTHSNIILEDAENRIPTPEYGTQQNIFLLVQRYFLFPYAFLLCIRIDFSIAESFSLSPRILPSSRKHSALFRIFCISCFQYFLIFSFWCRYVVSAMSHKLRDPS